MTLLVENALRHFHMDTVHGPVHELSDRDVACDTDKLIRLVLRQTFRLRKEVHHLLDGDARRDFQILI